MKARFDAMTKALEYLKYGPEEDVQRQLAQMRAEAQHQGAPVSSSGSERGSVASTSAASSEPTIRSASSLPSSSLTSTTTVSPSSPSPAPYISLVPKLTRAATQSFYSSSGKLFHVFTPEQTESYHKAVFGFSGQANGSCKVEICCLASVAAVGVQYNPADFEAGSDLGFYDLAKRYFADLAEQRSPDAIRVCTMLALYNVLIKDTCALGWAENGLALYRSHGVNFRLCYEGLPDNDASEDYRKAWTTLLFLQR